MVREVFIDNLRLASRLLGPQYVDRDLVANEESSVGTILNTTDLWFTAKSVEGYCIADFKDWPNEVRETLDKEIAAFRVVLEKAPTTASQKKQARKHLEAVIRTVRERLLPEWLEAQENMIAEATAAAKGKGWYVDKDEKEILESLLGSYKAPRLRIRTLENEVILDPIGYFGSGRQGIVDLVVMPAYETAYLITFKQGAWQIVSQQGTLNRRPFTQSALVNTISKLSHA